MSEIEESASEEGGHRIRVVIATTVQDGVAGKESAHFTPEGLETIRTEIRSFLGKPELIDCVEDVLTIVGFLELEEKSPKAAQALYELVENPEVIESLKAINRHLDAERADNVAKAADKLQQFTGQDSQKKAPKADEETPKGTMKLGNLDFPKKL